MKITKRDILVILYIVSVLALFIVYKFVVTPALDEIDNVNNENAGLQSRVTTLEAKVERQGELAKQIDEMDVEIKELSSKYPASISEEDIIKYVDEVNKEIEMNVTSVSFSQPSTVYTVVGNGAAAKYSMALNQISVTVDYTTDYDGFKRIVNYINEDKEHREIASVGLNVSVLVDEETEDSTEGDTEEETDEDNEEGNTVIKDPLNGNNVQNEGEQVIAGSFSLVLYYLDGKILSGDEVPRFEEVEVPHGVDNIFEEPVRTN